MIKQTPIRLAIVDDDEQIIRMLSQYLEEINSIELVGTANNVETGLELVKNQQIDVLLIDLIMPNHDGFYMLDQLNQTCDNKPACIILSALNAPHMIAKAAELGAEHFVLKPFDMALLMERILEIASYKKSGNIVAKSPSRRIDDYIQTILDGLPLSHALTGHRYVKTAVRMAIEDPSMLDGITKRLYPEVAKDQKSTSSRVERAIRYAIHIIWQRQGGPERFAELMGFPMDTTKPTNSHFIASIVGRYRYFNPQD